MAWLTKYVMKYFVYELYDPNAVTPFYVGWSDSTNKGDVRPYEHIKEALRLGNTSNSLKTNVIRKIINSGNEVKIEIIYRSDDFSESLLFEKEQIAKWGRRDLKTGCLTNMTDGGEGKSGVIDSDKTRRLKSQGRLGKRHSAESKAKIKETRKNQVMKPWSDASRKRMSENCSFRKNAGKTYEDIFGDAASDIRAVRSAQLTARRADPKLERRRVESHRITWILKMADIYLGIFKMLDEGYKYKDIRSVLGVSGDTVRKAVRNRTEIESIINENQ